MVTNMAVTHHRQQPDATLPSRARLPINRCNLPPVILGGLTFQSHPQALEIDGVKTFHGNLFAKLIRIEKAADRAHVFQDYMAVTFRLDTPEDVGGKKGQGRSKSDYLRLLRGWFFDSDGREGAVLKSWAESRFGLLTRYHKGPIQDPSDAKLAAFLKDRADGLHNTNALEAQVDLVYTFCQSELQHLNPQRTHLTLYRGVNRLDDFDVLEHTEHHHPVMLFNNVNSFTSDRDTADAFGDHILTVEVPLSKIVFYSGLLPGRMTGECEFIVLGGVYAVKSAIL